MMSTPAILAENLTYQYGERVAVNHIDFQVAEGEIVAFLGPNGAGKSTTVKLLTGQLLPKEGRALLLGHDMAREAARARPLIGVGFETPNLYEQMTAVENLTLFARLFRVPNFDAAAMLEKVGLANRGHEKVEGYSKGMKQRLMIARALVNQPRVLFLDEPTDGLDPVSSETIRSIIRDQSQAGATVFLCTHDMFEADKLANRVAFMHQGSIVALDSPHALKQTYGQRALKVEVSCADGSLQQREIILDRPETGAAMQQLFDTEQVVTVHSAEATLEDIFIRLTGQGLV
jgi:ABC-type multidrug transport system ATPase subunit